MPPTTRLLRAGAKVAKNTVKRKGVHTAQKIQKKMPSKKKIKKTAKKTAIAGGKAAAVGGVTLGAAAAGKAIYNAVNPEEEPSVKYVPGYGEKNKELNYAPSATQSASMASSSSASRSAPASSASINMARGRGGIKRIARRMATHNIANILTKLAVKFRHLNKSQRSSCCYGT